jgi:hypothetical protein
MTRKKHRGQSAAFMRSINPHLHKARKHYKGGSSSMVRHRYKRHHSKSAFGGSAVWKTVVGVGGYTLVWEPFVAPLITQYTGLSSTTESVVELAIGAYFMKNKGVIGDVAKAAVVINSYKLMSGVVRPMIIGH